MSQSLRIRHTERPAAAQQGRGNIELEALASAAYPTLHHNQGNTGADATQTTITLADPTPAGKEASLDVYVGGFHQAPDQYTCDGSTTCTLAFTMRAHTDWFVIHARPYH